jgi:hypothetical protein
LGLCQLQERVHTRIRTLVNDGIDGVSVPDQGVVVDLHALAASIVLGDDLGLEVTFEVQVALHTRGRLRRQAIAVDGWRLAEGVAAEALEGVEGIDAFGFEVLFFAGKDEKPVGIGLLEVQRGQLVTDVVLLSFGLFDGDGIFFEEVVAIVQKAGARATTGQQYQPDERNCVLCRLNSSMRYGYF